MVMLTDLVARIEKMVGPSIHNMLMEGKRRDTGHYIESLVKGPYQAYLNGSYIYTI